MPSALAVRRERVADAVWRASARTGVNFDYLMDQARVESGFDANARAQTSSATGLFQFIEQTWLGIVRSEGDKVGLSAEAKAIVPRPEGGFAVADPATRQAILKLREDPGLASYMAGALTRQNREALEAATAREPSAGELYMAHVLGARGAADLIAAAEREPGRAAADDFPEAARANRGIFYDRSGRARGAGEVYRVLSASQASPGGSAPPSPVAAAPERPPGLNGMFQTGSRVGPISDAVAKIWRVNNADGARTRVAALSYFPRSRPVETASDASPVAAPSVAAPAAAPAATADPVRPLAITVTRAAPPAPAAPAPAGPTAPPLPPRRPRSGLVAAPAGAAPAGAGQPLSLSSFMTGPAP
jgi:hypothetical protein